MTQWIQQITANYQAIQSILSSTKNISELGGVVSALADADLIGLYKNGVTLKMTLEELKDYLSLSIQPPGPFIWIETEGCYIRKGAGNLNDLALEDGDRVYHKLVTDTNGDTSELFGHEYQGGASGTRENYIQNITIEL